MSGTLCAVEGLVKSFPPRGGGTAFTAVDGVSFAIDEGETVGLVGETGAGKSTIGRCILGLERPSGGRIRLLGQDTATLGAAGWRRIRRGVQAVFQDPKGAMNPRWSVRQLVGEPLARLTDAAPPDIDRRVRAGLEAVGLGPEFLPRYRHQLSGGQQQRVNIARALVVEPRCLVLDEPLASLDAAVRRDIVRLLGQATRDRGIACLLISHDLNAVRLLCRTVVILFRGRIVEKGATAAVLVAPRHPYTRRLLSAQLTLPGQPLRRDWPDGADAWLPDADSPPPRVGELVEVGPEHFVAEEGLR